MGKGQREEAVKDPEAPPSAPSPSPPQDLSHRLGAQRLFLWPGPLRLRHQGVTGPLSARLLGDPMGSMDSMGGSAWITRIRR